MYYEVISIHASTRDATLSDTELGTLRHISIHASTRDATRVRSMGSHVSTYFNPRIHKGWRRKDENQRTRTMYFNPRIHKGCDFKNHGAIDGARIFQSTHPQGMRRLNNGQTEMTCIFQSTHPQGMRLRKTALSSFLV